MSIMSGLVQNSAGLGRIKRDLGSQRSVLGIVEATDDIERDGQPVEVNSGVYCFQADWLWENLGQAGVGSNGESYLTDLAAVAAETGASVAALASNDSDEALGINNRIELAHLEDIQRRRIRERLMLAGVTITDPSSVMIDADVTIGQDTVILPNTMILGSTAIGSGCEVGPGSVVKDSKIGDDCRVTSSALVMSPLLISMLSLSSSPEKSICGRSKIRTDWPASTNFSTNCLPTLPAPPVMSIGPLT